jgi:hypothetical protein
VPKTRHPSSAGKTDVHGWCITCRHAQGVARKSRASSSGASRTRSCRPSTTSLNPVGMRRRRKTLVLVLLRVRLREDGKERVGLEGVEGGEGSCHRSRPCWSSRSAPNRQRVHGVKQQSRISQQR